tara:strand:+ start:226 stop:762 length:537 start_codon:yes stop_codon:yes gene_type:complete
VKTQSFDNGDSDTPLAPNWKLVQSLSENWFDPKLEFCQSFYASPITAEEDPRAQHEVVKHVAAFLNTAGGCVLIGFGMKGKLLGLIDDDIRSLHHYQHRLEETLRKCLGDAAQSFAKVHMIRWGSEDVCLINCEKAEFEVICVHTKYNQVMGIEKREKLVYRRTNAQTIDDSLSESSE